MLGGGWYGVCVCAFPLLSLGIRSVFVFDIENHGRAVTWDRDWPGALLGHAFVYHETPLLLGEGVMNG